MSELIDNRAHRVRKLKSIITRLHEGADPESVRQELAEIVRETDSSEVAAMEQSLIAEGMKPEQIRSMCDLHLSVLRDVMREGTPSAAVAPGHPLETFRRENEAIRSHVRAMRELGDALVQPNTVKTKDDVVRWRGMLNELMDVDKHYVRKENLLFSKLEKYGITGPSQVMWAKDDEVRGSLKAVEANWPAGDVTIETFRPLYEQHGRMALAAAEGMVEKEERVLLPLSQQTLTDEDWAEIFEQSPEYGWCLVEPRQGYTPPPTETPSKTVELPADRAVTFPTGHLTFEQLLGIFKTMPVDITFVDADDRVRFFSEGPDRVFARSKAILGRKVHHCHPPKSVHVVEQIVSDFRSGRQDAAEFWITFRGRFVHIRYFAVRDEAGAYLGTLEVTQDLTHLRELTGERRLLQYDTPTTN